MSQSNRLSWHDLFMQIAKLTACRSEDPHTKVGACLVKDNHVIGIGYNGKPRKFNDTFNWNTPEKYDYVIHAEMNAIANACAIGANVIDSEIFLTLSPCHECMKLIAQHQIKKVHFIDTYKDFELSLKIATACDIKMVQVTEKGERQWN